MEDIIGTILMVFVIGGILTAYFFPSMLAFGKKKDNRIAILALNIFAGWTFFGWIFTLVWSLTKDS